MKHNLKVPVRTFNGQLLTHVDAEGKQVPTDLQAMLELVCINADPRQYDDRDKKLRVYRLLEKVHGANPTCDLTAEDVILLKELVGRSLSITAVGPICDLLENPIRLAEEHA